MATTSDERREVAERMRGIMRENPNVWFDVMVARSVLDVMGKAAIIGETVADLIDPTCHLVSTTSEEGLYGPTIFHHELSCGHTCETGCKEPPAYCSECGARVVTDDD